jgi:hypothetical protein
MLADRKTKAFRDTVIADRVGREASDQCAYIVKDSHRTFIADSALA